MKNYKIKPVFLAPMAQAHPNKTGFNFMIFILIFVENFLYYDAINNFSVWLRTGSNPADTNRFRNYTKKFYKFHVPVQPMI